VALRLRVHKRVHHLHVLDQIAADGADDLGHVVVVQRRRVPEGHVLITPGEGPSRVVSRGVE